MKTTAEKIAVMQAFLDGKTLRKTSVHGNAACIIRAKPNDPAEEATEWDWIYYDYDVVEDQPTSTVEKELQLMKEDCQLLHDRLSSLKDSLVKRLDCLDQVVLSQSELNLPDRVANLESRADSVRSHNLDVDQYNSNVDAEWRQYRTKVDQLEQKVVLLRNDDYEQIKVLTGRVVDLEQKVDAMQYGTNEE